jgi:hypothetical protein
MSKSSSEDEKGPQYPEASSSSERRNSQDLEFNDQNSVKSTEYVQKPRARLLPELPTSRRDSGNDHTFENAGLVNLPRPARRRTYSDDYENPCRRKYSVTLRDIEWDSDSTPRFRYLEVEESPPAIENPKPSSYRSPNSTFLYETKRTSLKSTSCKDRIEVSHKRSMSHYESKFSASQPTTEFDDLYQDFRTAKLNDDSLSNRRTTQHLRRNSTWYTNTRHN